MMDEASKERQANILTALLSLASTHRTLVAPTLIPLLLEVAELDEYEVDVRLFAMTILIVLADSKETQSAMRPVLVPMKRIFESHPDDPDLRKSSLDVISNLCIHSSPDDTVHQWEQLGATEFLMSLLKEEGFVGVQAAIALTHLQSSKPYKLPDKTLEALMDLAETTLDGDIEFGIVWELVPGPLSALYYYLQQQEGDAAKEAVAAALVKDEVLPMLMRVLEEAEDDPTEWGIAWNFLLELAQIHRGAQHWLLLAESSLQSAHSRVVAYANSERVASKLIQVVHEFDFGQQEL